LNLARAQQEDFGLVLTRYALERLLYRLSRSAHGSLFVLKGALLFQVWGGPAHRPTRDLDLLCQGESTISRFESIFRDICRQNVEGDGLEFRAETVQGERIREDEEYQGVWLHCEARLAGARIPLQIDLGFGDAITPAAVPITYPVLLDFPAPALRAYPRETVIAEKFQAMVMLGKTNSRMKDFYDLWVLARRFAFEGTALGPAIQATFQRRRTDLPSQLPVALSPAFLEDEGKQTQWRAFLRKSKLDVAEADLERIAAVLRDFLMPPTAALIAGRPFALVWPVGGPWQLGSGTETKVGHVTSP
jgi:predicted nucleotidyltransferase component of viral defense system